MFDQAELLALPAQRLNDWRRHGSYRGLGYHVHSPEAFSVPESEQMLRIARAPREANDNGLKFWIHAESLDDWGHRQEYFHPYLSSSRFRRMDEGEFNRLVAERTRELVVPLPLPLHPPTGYLGGLAMRAMEDDLIVSLFAEYEDEFIHALWETTA